MCPTQKLANQIGEEAQKLLAYHPRLTAQVITGGTKIGGEITRVNGRKKKLPKILMGTPGRLFDHLEGTLFLGRKFENVLSDVKVLVLIATG